jgi:hypothetical protein
MVDRHLPPSCDKQRELRDQANTHRAILSECLVATNVIIPKILSQVLVS